MPSRSSSGSPEPRLVNTVSCHLIWWTRCEIPNREFAQTKIIMQSNDWWNFVFGHVTKSSSKPRTICNFKWANLQVTTVSCTQSSSCSSIGSGLSLMANTQTALHTSCLNCLNLVTHHYWIWMSNNCWTMQSFSREKLRSPKPFLYLAEKCFKTSARSQNKSPQLNMAPFVRQEHPQATGNTLVSLYLALFQHSVPGKSWHGNGPCRGPTATRCSGTWFSAWYRDP